MPPGNRTARFPRIDDFRMMKGQSLNISPAFKLLRFMFCALAAYSSW
jgi:hypothetical protein